MGNLSHKVINSPVKWAGGKYKIRKVIADLLPKHTCYVEVFGGAAWVLMAKEKSEVEILNDIDGDLINFFRVIKGRPDEFIESFDLTLISREVFEDLRNQPSEGLSDLERAHRFFYLIMASWGGEFKSPRFQTSVSDTGGHGNRLIGALKNLRKRILPAHERLQTVIIENLDWRECIRRYDRNYDTKQVVMYLDPPYPGNNVNYKYNMREWELHEELANSLRQLKSRFLLTTYDVDITRELFRDFNILPINFAAGMPSDSNGGKTRNRELIVTNYDTRN